MPCRPQAIALMRITLGLLILPPTSVRASDTEINQLLQRPVARDWVTNGGNLTNQR